MEQEKRLVIVGGAAGMRSLNESAPAALSKLAHELTDWQVVHQTGEGQLQETEQRYQSCGVPALVVSHIDEMASLLFETDLVVCRPGGTMLAELALAGVPAVLVPAPTAEGDQQLANARIAAQETGFPVIDEQAVGAGLTGVLEQELRSLLVDTAKRDELASAGSRLAQPEAAERIAELICDALCGAGGLAAA